MLQIEQVFPGASRMQPFSPQFGPQMFFTLQQLSVTPTSRAAKFMPLSEQLFRIPDLQVLQDIAFTPTETGPFVRRLTSPLQSLVSEYPEILKGPVEILQVCCLPAQGYTLSSVIPLSLMKLYELTMKPPLHPKFPYFDEQSISICSEMDFSVPSLILDTPSTAPVVEKAQQAPHCPSSLIAVTAPWLSQSIEVASQSNPSLFWTQIDSGMCRSVRQMAWNSDWVRTVNWLTPI